MIRVEECFYLQKISLTLRPGCASIARPRQGDRQGPNDFPLSWRGPPLLEPQERYYMSLYRRFQARFGTAGIVIGVIALAMAMVTGAYAAGGGLSGKQKKEVSKI